MCIGRSRAGTLGAVLESTRQYCLTLELKCDRSLIEAYDKYHQPGNVWPEVIRSIRDSGVQAMRIYRSGIHLTMIIDVNETFDPQDKERSDKALPRVLEWERLMETFQNTGEYRSGAGKWKSVNCIFDLSEH